MAFYVFFLHLDKHIAARVGWATAERAHAVTDGGHAPLLPTLRTEPALFIAFVAVFLFHHLYMLRYFRERDVMATGMHDFPGEAAKHSR